MGIKALLVGLLLLATAGSAFAAGPYIGFEGGLSRFHDADLKVAGTSSNVSYNSGYDLAAAAGYNFDFLRLEFEYGYRKADLNAGTNGTDSNLAIMSYMINGYYDIKTGTVLTPYVGGGIGFLHGDLDLQDTQPFSQEIKVDKTVFGYQVAVGTAIAVDKNINLDIGYKFQGAGSDFSKNGISLAYLSSNFFAGFRFGF